MEIQQAKQKANLKLAGRVAGALLTIGAFTAPALASEVTSDIDLVSGEDGTERTISRHYFKGYGFDIGVQEVDDDTKLHFRYNQNSFGFFYNHQRGLNEIGGHFPILEDKISGHVRVVDESGQKPRYFLRSDISGSNFGLSGGSWYEDGEFDVENVSYLMNLHNNQIYGAFGSNPNTNYGLSMTNFGGFGSFGFSVWNDFFHSRSVAIIKQPGVLFNPNACDKFIKDLVFDRWDPDHVILGGIGKYQLTVQDAGTEDYHTTNIELGAKLFDDLYVGAGVVANTSNGETEFGLGGSINGSVGIGPVKLTGEAVFDGVNETTGIYAKLGTQF